MLSEAGLNGSRGRLAFCLMAFAVDALRFPVIALASVKLLPLHSGDKLHVTIAGRTLDLFGRFHISTYRTRAKGCQAKS